MGAGVGLTLITEDERRDAAIEEAGREGVCDPLAIDARTGGVNDLNIGICGDKIHTHKTKEEVEILYVPLSTRRSCSI